jgi:hypothetical protein
LFAAAASRPPQQHYSTTQDDVDKALEKHLYEIARRLKLEIYDLDEGIFGYDSQDSRFGMEVVQTSIRLQPDDDYALGLTLMEFASSADGRGLVLMSDVAGSAAQADPPICVGDLIVGIKTTNFQERTARHSSTTQRWV